VIAMGVDPGFAFVGIGVLDMGQLSTRVLLHQTFKTSSKADDEARLDAIAERLIEVIDQYQPAIVSYENQAIVEAGKHRMRRKRAELGDTEDAASNFSSARVHEVAGAIRCAARLFELPCYCHAPSTIKVSVLGKGGGHAKKDQMIAAVRTIFGVACSQHAADALAAAVAGVRKHRQALLKLRASKSIIT
jgi:Holliday junction resolvasome RuvABC endonuclease subunit